MDLRKALLAAAAALAVGPALACYTIYDAGNRMVYNSELPPFDMSRPLHQSMGAAYPGSHLVFEPGASCPVESPARSAARPPAFNGRSPLLTNVATARAMGVPHTIVANGVALVQQRPDEMRPGVVVAESGLPPAAAPDTRMMGAGPAAPSRPATGVMGTAPGTQYPPAAVQQPGVNRSR